MTKQSQTKYFSSLCKYPFKGAAYGLNFISEQLFQGFTCSIISFLDLFYNFFVYQLLGPKAQRGSSLRQSWAKRGDPKKTGLWNDEWLQRDTSTARFSGDHSENSGNALEILFLPPMGAPSPLQPRGTAVPSSSSSQIRISSPKSHCFAPWKGF